MIINALVFLTVLGTIFAFIAAAHLVIERGWHLAEAAFVFLLWPLSLLALAAYGAYLVSKRVRALLDEHEEEEP